MTIITKTVYIYKNEEYSSMEEARQQEMFDTDKIARQVAKYLRDNPEYVGVKGVWVIKDGGDVDGEPTIAYVEGDYRDAVKYAFERPNFVGYGPGTVEPLKVVKV